MPSDNLTDEKCRRATAKRGKVTEYLDRRQRGLALRVSPPSAKTLEGVKSWTVRYRTATGAQRRISLGTYPAVALSTARQSTLAVLASVAAGKDPAIEKKEARARAQSARLDTVKAIGEHYFAEAEKGRHRANARPKRTSTIALERYYFDRHVASEFGTRPLAELTRGELQAFINKMEDEHSPSTARQCRVVLQRLYALARWQEITEANPCQHVHAPQDKERERVLSDHELQVIWAATHLPLTGAFHMSPSLAVALRLLTVTMQRRSEVAGMHTREVDRVKRIWIIPGERTKNHLTHAVPLSDTALELIEAALALAGRKTGYLFPSPRDAKKPITSGSLTKAFGLLAQDRKLHDVRLHDLRRTAATHLTGERIGIPRFMVSRVLNQISDTGGAAAVTRVYDRNEYLAEKRRALDAWAVHLALIVSTGPQSDIGFC